MIIALKDLAFLDTVMLFAPLIQKWWVQCLQSLKQAAPEQQCCVWTEGLWLQVLLESPQSSACGSCGFIGPSCKVNKWPSLPQTGRPAGKLGTRMVSDMLQHGLACEKKQARIHLSSSCSSLGIPGLLKRGTLRDLKILRLRTNKMRRAVSCGSERGEGRPWVQKRGCDGGSLGPGCAGELQLLGAGCFRCPLGNTLSLQTGFSAGKSANEWFSFQEHGGKCHTRKITVSVLLCVCLWTMRISMERNYSGPSLSSFSSLPFLCLVRLLPPSLLPLSKLGASVHLFAVRWTEQNLSPVL